MQYAAERGVLEPVGKLLNGGANINHQNHAGFSALHKSANEGHASIVQKLIRSGIDVSLKDKKGNTAGVTASGNGFTKLKEIIESHSK